MAGQEEHEHVARLHPGAELSEYLVEIVGRDAGIEDLADLGAGIESRTRLLQAIGERSGIRHRIGKPEPAVEIVVDADGEDIEFWRRRRLLAVPFD